ncbi:RibD family protein [Thalassospira sp.]|uniref:RibD family protein n=1 Tax=Thalassospira sp. TaxID=1912094 RepID=UPI000C3B0D3B|nr:RibD family protein [Thalassospira sp.]MBC06123.1 5-amino-6-(5-phosphoribosylamino)uracil reductase [Thalassospira sp.]
MRPTIVCHMITSLDGRLWAERWGNPHGGTIDDLIERHYDRVAETFGADGWMVGRRTMEHYAAGIREKAVPEASRNRPNHLAARTSETVGVAFDPSGRLLWDGGEIDGDHAIVVLADTVEESHLEHLREQGVSYLFAGPDGMDLDRALSVLASEFGLKKLLLEGGGKLNGAFLRAGLIDETSTLICPTIDGLKGVPSIYDYHGDGQEFPAANQELSLIGSETLEGGVVWLRHAVHRL